MELFIEWELSTYREKELHRFTENKESRDIDNMIEDWKLDHVLELGDREDELNVFFPRFKDDVSMEFRQIWSILSGTVSLEYSEFSVSVKESLSEILDVLKTEGVCHKTLRPIVQMYSNKLVTHYAKKRNASHKKRNKG